MVIQITPIHSHSSYNLQLDAPCAINQKFHSANNRNGRLRQEKGNIGNIRWLNQATNRDSLALCLNILLNSSTVTSRPYLFGYDQLEIKTLEQFLDRKIGRTRSKAQEICLSQWSRCMPTLPRLSREWLTITSGLLRQRSLK